MTQVGHVQAAVEPRAGTSQQLWATQGERHWDNGLACRAQPARNSTLYQLTCMAWMPGTSGLIDMSNISGDTIEHTALHSLEE